MVSTEPLTIDSLEFRLKTNNDYYRGTRLEAYMKQVLLENYAMIIEEAKLRMHNKLIEQAEELKRATLEYATGFKVN